MSWTDGFVLFPFSKDGSGVLADCSLCGTEATLSFSAGPVCSSFFRCSLCHSASSFLVSATPTSLPLLLLSDSRHPLSFYFNLSGRFSRDCIVFPPVLPRYNGLPDTRFSRGTMRRLMSWPDGKRFPRISHIHSYLFSDWRRTVSSKFFDTLVPSISTEELVFPLYARCVPSRLRCNGHSLLISSHLSRIGRIENPSCSACGHPSQDISHLILHCPATDSAPLALWRLSGPGPGELPGCWSSMVFRHAPILRKGPGSNNSSKRGKNDVKSTV